MNPNIAKALKHKVIMISGNEGYLVRKNINELIECAGLTKDDYDLESITGDSSSPTDWIANVGTLPFLSERRCLVVRYCLRGKIEELSADSLKSLPDSSLLILVCDDEGTSDPNSKATTKKKALEKLVTAAGGHLMNFASDPKKSLDMVKSEVHSSGRKVSNDAIQVLLEMTGGSMSRAIEEFEKVLLYTSNEYISESDIRAIVMPSREWNIWKMIDAMTQGNVSEALKQLQIVIASNKKAEEIAFASVFPQLSRSLRLLVQGRICIDAGVQPGSAPADILALFPPKPNLATEQSYRQSAVMRAARSVSLSQLRDALTILSDADASLKGMGTSFSPMDTIERLVFDLAVTLKAKSA